MESLADKLQHGTAYHTKRKWKTGGLVYSSQMIYYPAIILFFWKCKIVTYYGFAMFTFPYEWFILDEAVWDVEYDGDQGVISMG